MPTLLFTVVLAVLQDPLPRLHAVPDSLPRCLWSRPAEVLTPLPSPPDSTILRAGATTLKVCYSRPSVRGRRIFGEVVEYGKPWRTGANEPTFLFLSGPAEIAGVRLETGRYILMTVPGPDRWTILLSTSTAPTPVQMFGALVEVGRGQVPVERLDTPVERLTITAATGPQPGLLLEWEHVRVRLPVVLRR